MKPRFEVGQRHPLSGGTGDILQFLTTWCGASWAGTVASLRARFQDSCYIVDASSGLKAPVSTSADKADLF
jgi:hypothetical protein